MVIIGLSGKARAGKDSTVAIAQALLPTRVGRIAFADGVREEGLASGEWDGVVPYTTVGRTALQTIGARRRQERTDYWVDKALSKIDTSKNMVWVIPDVRYHNEAEAIHAAGGTVWRIIRANSDGTAYDNGLTTEQKAHPSEVELDDYGHFDEIIVARNLYELFRQVGEVLHSMGLA